MGKDEKDKAQQEQPQDTGGNQQQPKIYQDVYETWLNKSLEQKKGAVQGAASELKKASEAIDPAKEELDNASTKQMTLREALKNESKPVRKEDAEKMARRSAVIKGVGDLLSALTVGVHGYGKNGAGVVPTLAENSPLKDLDKLNQLQEEYAKRKEAWETLDRKVRMENQTAKTTKAKEAYEAALDKMATAQTRYDDAVEAVDAIDQDYGKLLANLATKDYAHEQQKEIVKLRTALSAAQKSGDSKDNGNKESEKDIIMAIYDILNPWQPTYNKDNRTVTTYTVDEPQRYRQALIDTATTLVYDEVLQNGWNTNEIEAFKVLVNENGYDPTTAINRINERNRKIKK